MTFSIVARDPKTGAFGVATATGGPCVGALVPHAASGVGAIATQGDTNPYFGIDGLALLGEGVPAAELVPRLTGADPGRATRQLIAIGATGQPAGLTGAEAIASAGLILGEHFAVAGNMLANDGVVAAIAAGFAESSGPLVDRLLAAMTAGETAGGDRRGTRSAALIVCSHEAYADFDCRVDLSGTPLADLEAVVSAARSGAYADFVAARPRRRTPHSVAPE